MTKGTTVRFGGHERRRRNPKPIPIPYGNIKNRLKMRREDSIDSW